MYDYLVVGSCVKKGKSGDFSLSILATSESEAQKQAVKDLQNAGYSSITVSKVHISRWVSE